LNFVSYANITGGGARHKYLVYFSTLSYVCGVGYLARQNIARQYSYILSRPRISLKSIDGNGGKKLPWNVTTVYGNFGSFNGIFQITVIKL
jgi:hypothetical protein